MTSSGCQRGVRLQPTLYRSAIRSPPSVAFASPSSGYFAFFFFSFLAAFLSAFSSFDCASRQHRSTLADEHGRLRCCGYLVDEDVHGVVHLSRLALERFDDQVRHPAGGLLLLHLSHGHQRLAQVEDVVGHLQLGDCRQPPRIGSDQIRPRLRARDKGLLPVESISWKSVMKKPDSARRML